MTSERRVLKCVLDFEGLTDLTDLPEALDAALRLARLTYLAAAGVASYQEEVAAAPEDEDVLLIRELADGTEQTLRRALKLYAKSVKVPPPAPAPSEDIGVIPLRRPHDATGEA